jgi:hypothetical protein
VVDLYKRKAAVEIDNLRVENMNVAFTISYEKLDFGKAEIRVFNLNETHRREIESREASTVSLFVGFENTPLDRIFNGVMRRAFSQKEGNTWVTVLQTGDGDKASTARINKSYRPGTRKSVGWNDLLSSLQDVGVGIGNAAQKFLEGNFKDGVNEFLNGGAVTGGAYNQLRKMARSANLDVQIQDGELVVSGLAEPLETSAILLSPTTGLIGPPQKGVKTEVKARALIIPGLRPKRLVQIESPSLSGLYIVQKAKYKGEVNSQDWYVDLECVER